MEPERYLPRSQVPATCSNRESGESNPTDLYKTYFYIIRSTSGAYKWSLSLKFPNLNHVCTSPLPYTCHLFRPCLSSWFDYPDNTCWGFDNMKLLIVQFPSVLCYLVPSSPKILSSTASSRTPSAYVLLQCERLGFHPCKTLGMIIVLCISVCIFLDRWREHRRSWTWWYCAFAGFSQLLISS